MAKKRLYKYNLKHILYSLLKKFKKERKKTITKEEIAKSDNFYITHVWMGKKLNIRGVEKGVFSIIYGFSKDGQGDFHGTRRYLADLCNCSTKSIDQALKRLLEKDLIVKKVWYDETNQKRCVYTINYTIINELRFSDTQRNKFSGCEESSLGREESSLGRDECFQSREESSLGRDESSHNNKYYNNKIKSVNNNSNKSVFPNTEGEVKRYGVYSNVLLTEFWYDYLSIESELVDEYIQLLDSEIQKKQIQTEYWPIKKYGETILDLMYRDGVASD